MLLIFAFLGPRYVDEGRGVGRSRVGRGIY